MAKKRRQGEEDNPLRWLATYGDVVTLMLAFFVMLYAISQVDEQKFELLVSGLESPFGNTAVREGLLSQGDGIVGEASVEINEQPAESVQGLAVLDGLPQLEETDAGTDGTDGDEDGQGTTLRTNEDLEAIREAIANALIGAELGEVVDFDVDHRGLVVAIATDEVLFASGSSRFGQRGEEIIAVIAPTLDTFDNEILVEGHTDDVPLDRNGYDNWNLSADRALAVLKLLTERHGLAPDRVSATGYGEFRPKASNESDQGKALNRRVELVIALERGDGDG